MASPSVVLGRWCSGVTGMYCFLVLCPRQLTFCASSICSNVKMSAFVLSEGEPFMPLLTYNYKSVHYVTVQHVHLYG